MLLYRAIRQADLSEFGLTLTQLQPASVAVLVLLQLTSLLLSAGLWARIISGISPEKFHGFKHLFEIFRINSAASIMESITPSSKLGGEGMKLLLLQRYTGENPGGIAVLVAAHKLIILLPLMLIAVTVFLSGFLYERSGQILDDKLPFESTLQIFNLPQTTLLVLVLMLLSGILLTLVSMYLIRRIPRLETSVTKLKSTVLLAFTSRKSLFTELICLSLLMWLLYPLKYYLVAQAYGIEISFSSISSATFIAYFTSLLPLTPGGLGTFELSMAHILFMNGLSLSEGLLIAGTGRLITFWFPLLISILFAASYVLPVRKKLEINRIST